MSTRKVRYKKLSVKTTLAVLREHQIDPSEYEQLSTEAQIATGVEQAEENVSRNLPQFGSVGHVVGHVITSSWAVPIITRRRALTFGGEKGASTDLHAHRNTIFRQS